MEFEIISSLNFSGNVSLSDLIPEESSSMLTHEIIITIVCFVGLLANILIIYSFFRNSKLRTPINIYVLNWAIADLVYLIITPSFYRMYAALESYTISEELFCVTLELATIVQIAAIFFNGILCIIWFMNIFVPYEGTYAKYILTLIWTMCFILTIIFTMFCIHDVFYLASHYFTFLGYAVLLHLVIIMHLTVYCRKIKNKKPYNKATFITCLTTTYVICCLPSFLCILYLSLVKYLSVFAACVSYLNSVLNVFILFKFNRHFKTTVLQIFRKDTTGYEDAADSIEEEEAEDDVYDRSYLNVTSDFNPRV